MDRTRDILMRKILTGETNQGACVTDLPYRRWMPDPRSFDDELNVLRNTLKEQEKHEAELRAMQRSIDAELEACRKSIRAELDRQKKLIEDELRDWNNRRDDK